MAENRTLLYVVYEQGDEKLGLKLARHGRDTGAFRVILWTPYWLPKNLEYEEAAIGDGAVYVFERRPGGRLEGFQHKLPTLRSVQHHWYQRQRP